MSEATAIHLMLKGLLSERSEEEKAKIEEAVGKIRAIIEEYGDNGLLAVTLIGAELAAKN